MNDAASADCPSCRHPLGQQPPPACPACGLPLPGSGGPLGRFLRGAGPQALLASGGVLLLTVAAVVFTAVAWRDLSALARGGLLAAVAGACALATRRLVARKLQRTAEATAVLTVILLGVLLNGLWQAGVFRLFADGRDMVAASAAALAAIAHLLASWTVTRSPHVLAAWLAPTALVAVGSRVAETMTAASAMLVSWTAVLTAATVAVVYAERRLTGLPRWRTATESGGAVLWLVAALTAISAVAGFGSTVPATGPWSVACGALIAVTAGVALEARRLARRSSAAWDPVGTAGAWFVTTTGAVAAIGMSPGPWSELAVLVPAAGGAAALWLLRGRRSRAGAVAGMSPVLLLSAVVFGRVLLWVCAVAAARITAPWAPVAEPLPAPDTPTLVLSAGVAAVTTAIIAALTRRRRGPVAGAPPVLVAAAVGTAVALGVAIRLWPAGGGVVVATLAAGGAALALRRGTALRGAFAVLVIATLVAVTFGLSGPSATIAALALTAVAAAASSVRDEAAADRGRPVVAGVAGLLTADLLGLAAAVPAAATDGPGPVGVAVAGAAGVGWVAVGRARTADEVAVTVDVVAAVGCSAGIALSAVASHAAWLAVALATLAAAATAVTVLRDDRRWMRWVATAAGSASSWTVLMLLEVDVVEAYTVPPALVVVALGALALRARPEESSWRVLGPGLGLLATPTVLQIAGDPDDLPRVTAAIVAGSLLAVVGRVHRLQAPLVTGVTALSVVALTQHDVVTDLMPRWLLLAAGGVLLLWLSMSYERQVRRMASVRRHVAAMR